MVRPSTLRMKECFRAGKDEVSVGDRVIFLAHGEPRIPWPILRQFLELIEEAGDIVPN